ncbi:MAG: LTA synthase family protein, partial [Azonexus sp.]|nr:LTA synthase family protein [Azonexus sp.]
MTNDQAFPAALRPVRLKDHLSFTALAMLALLAMYSLLRLALLVYNREQIGGASFNDLLEAFGNGLRFDLRLTIWAAVPLLLALLSPAAMRLRRAMVVWLTLWASVTLFLGLIELDFYHEFNQRLNGLVFQYLQEDPKTVGSMLWYGFPVLRYLLAWALGTGLMYWLFRRFDRLFRADDATRAAASRLPLRLAVLALCLGLALLGHRGTLRQGPPLRWGDAFTTTSVFANQLGLNGTLSLVAAAS